MEVTVPATDTRYEIKFVAPELEYNRLLLWVHQHQSCFYKEYPDRKVNNIYFDSHNFSCYEDNLSGASDRVKVRYRWYGSSLAPTKGVLEIKCKRNQYSWKKNFRINDLNVTPEMNWRDILGHLSEGLPQEAWKWMESHPLPILINRYVRNYYISRNDRIRVTLDTGLRIYDQTRNAYPNYYSTQNLPRFFVLEVKFPRELREKASQIVKDIPIRVSRCSKYIIGFNAINEC